MDYKSVLEEQIRELQKVQDTQNKQTKPIEACAVAHAIVDLIREIKSL